MALLLAGRRLPVLRYLSTLASYQRDNVFGLHTSSAGHYSSAGGSPTSGSGSANDEPAKTSPETPAASAATAAGPTPGEAGTQPTSTSQPATVGDDDEWTEVVHSSGSIYYWNQRTGETTQLGEPKPKAERGSGGRGAGSDSGNGAGAEGGGSAGRSGGDGGERGAAGHTHDPRAEAHLEDRTGTYASMGVLIGAFLGWVSQFV
ncbi:hypothetical protein PLESTB_000183200 [Pleodorina starrii]|uniref:Uncharacterized protein n=1 Tax=Pleodorina starrii TaxID=330485 RepID=A0A9W6EXV5_9CHLO|nr:hypothetical protein PLESTM_000513500 [Pleodorina starrii]GLC49107.1 hypothetical protein PLESTB_000183200 [Pleodorina starrii]GLC66098.1 hypothetical protein PLESTF_000384500 [Pleodorina starrii]